MSSDDERTAAAAEVIARSSSVKPRIGIVLGSGLGALADQIEDATVLPYDSIPHFPASSAPGHAGRLVLGHLESLPVAVMDGRVHLYEGYNAAEVAFPVRVLRQIGADTLLLTNAAGGVNRDYHPGRLMLIRDHINLTGHNPLVGNRAAPRFPDMTETYDRTLRGIARDVAHEQAIELAEGVYLAMLGPSYETPAEIRMAAILGADAVGMSTVVEAIAARQLGMRVLGLSCITNMAAGIASGALSEDEVIETAGASSETFLRLVRGIVGRLEERP